MLEREGSGHGKMLLVVLRGRRSFDDFSSTSQARSKHDPSRIVVTIDSNDRVKMSGRRIPIDALNNELQRLPFQGERIEWT